MSLPQFYQLLLPEVLSDTYEAFTIIHEQLDITQLIVMVVLHFMTFRLQMLPILGNLQLAVFSLIITITCYFVASNYLI